MKKYILGILSLALLTFYSCEKDNYDEPKSKLTGRVVYEGQNIGVRQTDAQVQLQLWQGGYQLYESIPIHVAQDGTFSAILFNGTYKLVTRDKNGPWVNKRDTVVVNVKGNTTIEYPVTPYYILKDESFNLTGNILTATFNVQEVTAGEQIENVTLYIHNTAFVDNTAMLKSIESTSKTTGAHTITMDISVNDKNEPITSITSKPILYARVGIKVKGVDQLLYTTGSIRVK